MTRPPQLDHDEYGARLGDAAFWAPHIARVVEGDVIAPPEVGSFPTFFVDDVVVKLFCERFDGRDSYEVERALGDLLRDVDEIPAPRLLDAGEAYPDEPWPWPYLVFSRAAGGPARSRPIGAMGAADLGAAVATLHQLAPPPATVRIPSGTTLDPADDQVLLHADLHADHVFLDDAGRLTSIIDWGDAFVGPRFYELAAVQLGLFFGDRTLLDAFLEGYGWVRSPDFVRQAYDAAKGHQFDVFNELPIPAGLADDELADLLFGPAQTN